MITVKGKTETSFTVKKSRFIGLAVRVEEERQAADEIEQRKKQNYDATHNCWAYVLENGAARYSDDGEPQGTAGLPMLDVIKKSGLSGVLVISTRYFGGTLLGAGGLVRAYTKSAADALEAAQKVELVRCSVFKCVFTYEIWAKAENALNSAGHIFDNIEFTSDVTVTLCVTGGSEESFIKQVTSLSLGKVSPALIGEKLVEVPIGNK